MIHVGMTSRSSMRARLAGHEPAARLCSFVPGMCPGPARFAAARTDWYRGARPDGHARL